MKYLLVLFSVLCLATLRAGAQRVNVAPDCSAVSASYTASWNNLSAVNDGVKGTGNSLANNQTWGCYISESGNAAQQRLTYVWDTWQTVDSVAVWFWTDLAQGNGVAVPESWVLEYVNAQGEMAQVSLLGGEQYGTERYSVNHVQFVPVVTKQMSLVMNALPNGTDKYSAMGVTEWEVWSALSDDPSDDLLSEQLKVWHDQCVADTLLKKRQEWYNRDEMLAAFAAYDAAGTDSNKMQTAIDMLQTAHEHFQAITDAYVSLRAEAVELYNTVRRSKFALRDSIKNVRATIVDYYAADEDHYEWVCENLPKIREWAELYTWYVKGAKVHEGAKVQLAATDYPGKDAFSQELAAAFQQLTACTTHEEFQSVIDWIQSAQAEYLSHRPSEWITIQNGQLWKTDKYATVQAHAPGFIRVGDIWYMCGEDRTRQWNPDVNLYSSTDLVHWKFEKKIIENGVTTPELGSSRMIERPKLLYNAKTGKYVVWCHYESGDYGASEAACFECDDVNGAYTYVWSGRPLDIKSRDCNVFQDTDGTAYFISTTDENRHLGLFRLSEDYHEAVEHTQLFAWQSREAPAIVKMPEGRYFMFNSACSGWDPNQCKYAYTSNLKSGWTGLTNVGNPISYDTQAAAILEIKGTKKTTYLYVGDRWQDPGLPESKTIIFPVSFNGTTPYFDYRERFDINFVTGEWRETPTEGIFADKSGWKVIDKSSEESGGGNAVFAIDGKMNTMWHTQYSGSVAPAPHYITIDMGQSITIKGFLASPRMDNSTNGLIRKYEFLVSQDGETWKTVSSGDWLPYCTEVDFAQNECRYIKLICKEGTYASVAELDVVLAPVPTDVELVQAETTNRTIVRRDFFSLDGRQITQPGEGIYIERILFSDGQTQSMKKIRK